MVYVFYLHMKIISVYKLIHIMLKDTTIFMLNSFSEKIYLLILEIGISQAVHC
jgi:hypothetical protein